ncbi:MAG: spore germination protein, partial [Clostridiales bacterium]|nr:spore germination protein [Clostridiales bacterium]
MGLFNTIKKLFIYREPLQGDQFELLEDASEEIVSPYQVPQPNMGESSQQNATYQTPMGKQPKGKKSPLRVEEWNLERQQDPAAPKTDATAEEDRLSKDLEHNRARIQEELNIPTNRDAKVRNLRIGKSTKAFIVYIEGMADSTTINDFILRPLMTADNFESLQEKCSADYILENILTINGVTKASDYTHTISQILEGKTALFIDGSEFCLLVESRGFEKRNVDQPV